MILFREDWLKYPKAIVHLKTKNKSALDLAAKLRLMGVKNNVFFLSLLDPSLEEVDPYSENLTLEQMSRIAVECKNNPWYVLREIARAPALSGTESTPMQLNRANICLWWCFFNHLTNILVQPRQTGKSFSTDWLMTTLMNFVCNNTQINLMTKDDKLRSENIARLKKIYDELPPYLNFKTREDANNTEELSVKRFGNTYKTHVPQASEKKAYNLGRGMTTPIFQIDEAPFQANIEVAVGAALMSMGAAIDAAKAAGEPYGVIYTTTAGKIDDKDGSFVYGLVQNSAIWDELFYDCVNVKELETLIRRHAKSESKDAPGPFRVYSSFSYQQLGKDDAWAIEQIERSSISGQDADRDIFNIWTSGSQSSPLKSQTIAKMNGGACDPTTSTISSIGAYITRWYTENVNAEQYIKTRKVVLSVDTSDASGGDEIGMTYIDVETGELLGIGSYNETNLITYVRWLVWLLANYPDITLVIERRSSAITIIDYLFLQLPELGIDPFKRIFNWVVNDPEEHRDKFEEIKLPMNRRDPEIYTRSKKFFGFATSGTGQTSRTELYSTTLMTATDRFGHLIRDRTLISQILGLVEKNGRIDHAAGSRDDLVIAYLLGIWFLTKARNLGHYGIDVKKILKPVEVLEHLTDQERYEKMQQMQLRIQIENIGERLSNETCPITISRLMNQLYMLNSQLVLEEGEDFSLDVFLESLKAKRKEETTHKYLQSYNQPTEFTMRKNSYVRKPPINLAKDFTIVYC
jgi:hypothetical protein